MHGRDTERQMRQRVVVLLRDNTAATIGAVGMGIDHARHHGFTGNVDHPGTSGDHDVAANRCDAVVCQQNGGALEYLAIGIHRDDAGVSDGGSAGRRCGGDLHRKIDAAPVDGLRLHRLGNAGGNQRRADCPRNGLAVSRPLHVKPADVVQPAGRQCFRLLVVQANRLTGTGAGRDVDVEALLVGKVCAIG